jgi:hypothetical protein
MSPDQQGVVTGYRKADVAEKQRLKDEKNPRGQNVVSAFESSTTQIRTNLRRIDPELDARLLFWGRTEKVLTPRAVEVYNDLLRRYRPGAELLQG